MRHKLIVQLLIKNGFSTVFDHRTAAGNDSVKSDRIQLRVLYVSTAAPAAQERQMPVLPQARIASTVLSGISFFKFHIVPSISKNAAFFILFHLLHPLQLLLFFLSMRYASHIRRSVHCQTFPQALIFLISPRSAGSPFHTSDLLSCQPACRLMLLQHQIS